MNCLIKLIGLALARGENLVEVVSKRLSNLQRCIRQPQIHRNLSTGRDHYLVNRGHLRPKSLWAYRISLAANHVFMKRIFHILRRILSAKDALHVRFIIRKKKRGRFAV